MAGRSVPPGANSGTSAMSGMAARSWNSKMEKATRPCLVLISPFSSSNCNANAVEDSDRASPMNTASRVARLSAKPMAASGIAVAMSWTVPSPKIVERMLHSRCGRSSSPITNSNITTPNSAKWRMFSTS